MTKPSAPSRGVQFRAWLSDQRDRQDPVGELARLVLGTAMCPSTCMFSTWASLSRHLVIEHGDLGSSVFAAVRAAGREWKRFAAVRGLRGAP